jgi:hypothetical protein
MFSSYTEGLMAQTYVRFQRKSVVSNAEFLSVDYNKAGPSHWLKQKKLIVRANYNKQQHPGSYFLEVKGKLHRQEMLALPRHQNLHEKIY